MALVIPPGSRKREAVSETRVHDDEDDDESESSTDVSSEEEIYSDTEVEIVGR